MKFPPDLKLDAWTKQQSVAAKVLDTAVLAETDLGPELTRFQTAFDAVNWTGMQPSSDYSSEDAIGVAEKAADAERKNLGDFKAAIARLRDHSEDYRSILRARRVNHAGLSSFLMRVTATCDQMTREVDKLYSAAAIAASFAEARKSYSARRKAVAKTLEEWIPKLEAGVEKVRIKPDFLVYQNNCWPAIRAIADTAARSELLNAVSDDWKRMSAISPVTFKDINTFGTSVSALLNHLSTLEDLVQKTLPLVPRTH